MNEFAQGFIGSFGILLVLISSVFYWIGGRPNGRIWKRMVTPLFFALACVGFSVLKGHFAWWYLLAVPIYLIPQPGYGADGSFEKIFRRGLWAIFHCLRSLIFVIFSGSWLLFGIQMFFALVASIGFGAFNPFPNAPEEEGLIYFTSSFLVPFVV